VGAVEKSNPRLAGLNLSFLLGDGYDLVALELLFGDKFNALLGVVFKVGTFEMLYIDLL